MFIATKPELFLKKQNERSLVTVSGLNMCFGIFMKHYKGFDFDAVVAGHFNTPEMFDPENKTFTRSGNEFLNKYKQFYIDQKWDVNDIEILIYYAEKTEGKTHKNSDDIILGLKMYFNNMSINHIATLKGKDYEGRYTFGF